MLCKQYCFAIFVQISITLTLSTVALSKKIFTFNNLIVLATNVLKNARYCDTISWKISRYNNTNAYVRALKSKHLLTELCVKLSNLL